MKIKPAIQLFRLHQWIKNTFIFLPLFFGGQLTNVNEVYDCLIAFLSFALASSSIYCFNDIYDVDADRQHPKKRYRPVASGAISIPTAYALMFFCLALSGLILLFFGKEIKYDLILFIGFYYLLNIAYCIVLKKFAVVDVMIIAFGFVIRVLAGARASGSEVSEWIVVMTFLLTLFIAFAKRRDDVIIYQNTGVQLRKNTNSYNLNFVNQVMTIIATIIIVAYIMYTISPEVTGRFHCRYVYVTAIFVLAGIVRYLQIALVDSQSDDPIKILLRDRFIQICVFAWLFSFLLIIYGRI
jgi:4-hydroxybenzoate polyprenyltransferase